MLSGASLALVVSLLTSGVIFSGQTTSQSRNHSGEFDIRGKIVLPENRNVDRRIEVNLEKSELEVIQTTFADAVGNFSFSNLVPGAYYVAVNLEGYEPVHQLVEVLTMSGHSGVTIFPAKLAVTIEAKAAGLDADDPDVIDVSQMKDRFPKKAVQDYEKAI